MKHGEQSTGTERGVILVTAEADREVFPIGNFRLALTAEPESACRKTALSTSDAFDDQTEAAGQI